MARLPASTATRSSITKHVRCCRSEAVPFSNVLGSSWTLTVLSSARLCASAVYLVCCTGYPTSLVGCEEVDEFRDLFRRPGPAHRMRVLGIGNELRVILVAHPASLM